MGMTDHKTAFFPPAAKITFIGHYCTSLRLILCKKANSFVKNIVSFRFLDSTPFFVRLKSILQIHSSELDFSIILFLKQDCKVVVCLICDNVTLLIIWC